MKRKGTLTRRGLELYQANGFNFPFFDIYTHTEETNNHVIELNKKNGYHEVRRGPIWDEVIRVSLIKQLS